MEWKELEQELIKCIKCGSCQSVCPIFQELQSEAAVARGKVSLLKSMMKGNVDETGNFAEKMALCLNCKACVKNCPSGTKVDELVLHARGKLAEDRGLPLLKRIVLRLALRNRNLFDLGMKLGAPFQGLLFRKSANGEGMLPRLPMGLDQKRLLSPLAGRPLRSRLPQRIAAPGSRGTVAFFSGCTMNYIYPDIGEAIITVLLKNGFSVILPPQQHCCGTPAYANGDTSTAIELAKATVDHFASLAVDAVITGCGSCGYALKHEYPHWLKNERGYQGQAETLAAKTYDFTEYLVNMGGLQGRLSAVNRSVTYHESCHLTRGQGIKQQPRQLLSGIPGVQWVELQDPGRCCGAAGSFSLTHYELSRKINQHKVEDIAASGADTVAMGCPLCIMHIKDGLHQNDSRIAVKHTAEIIAEAYRE